MLSSSNYYNLTKSIFIKLEFPPSFDLNIILVLHNILFQPSIFTEMMKYDKQQKSNDLNYK